MKCFFSSIVLVLMLVAGNSSACAQNFDGTYKGQFNYVSPAQGTLSSRRMNRWGQWGYDISKPPRGGVIEPSGYWKYDSQSFRPTNEYYATIKPLPGRVYELRVTGGLQAGPGDAKGSIEQFFKTDNADRVVHLTTSTLTFGANANLVTLVPLQKVVFELGLVFGANDAVRTNGPYWGYGSGNIAIDNGEYIVSVSTKPGEAANAKGEATIPGGGPGATMFIHVGSGLSQLGAMHTILDIGYVWVAGTPPNPTTGSPNLALNRPAKQSSASQWSQPNDAQGAVDGNVNGGFGFHTESERNPWWQVDLGAVKALSEIRIFNRRDCCSERARTLQVLLSNDGVSWTLVFSNPGTVFGADGTPLRISVKGLAARFVRLQLAEANYLHLDEVQVYGAGTPGAGATPTSAVRTEPPSPPSQPPSQPPVKLPAGAEDELFNSMNTGGVGNGPTAPATFTIGQPQVITSITTYHWNEGRGTRAGTIALRDATGLLFGPWGVAGSPGQGGVPNAFWTATPNVTLPAGTYTIIDSETATWSQNSQSGNRGFSTVKSYPTGAVPLTKPPVNPINILEDRLGREWSETENEYLGRWVRRGNSKIWDASWNNGAVAELSISLAVDKVTINRRDVAGPSIGLTSIYEGTLAPDGTMHGTETVTFAGNPTSSRFDWQARLVAP